MPKYGTFGAEFDVDKSRSIPWQLRPGATALLGELKNPNREFDAVVVGEPHRAFYGNQYGLTFPIFEHYGVPLWVPEVGGPIDPRNEAHDLVMSVFGGMSKGVRNRIKIGVKAAMGAQAKAEGRFWNKFAVRAILIIPTRCAASRSAACADGGCKATGSTMRLTTGAGSPPSTPSPTAYNIR